jgi:hypothetical protein
MQWPSLQSCFPVLASHVPQFLVIPLTKLLPYGIITVGFPSSHLDSELLEEPLLNLSCLSTNIPWDRTIIWRGVDYMFVKMRSTLNCLKVNSRYIITPFFF